MEKIGRRIYYDKETGNVLVNTGQRQGFVKETTIEQDIQNYKALSERNRDTFDYIELEYGQYDEDFSASNGYRINPETKELEFSYPDSENPDKEPEKDDFRKPLSEELDDLKNRTQSTEDAIFQLMMGDM